MCLSNVFINVDKDKLTKYQVYVSFKLPLLTGWTTVTAYCQSKSRQMCLLSYLNTCVLFNI